MFSIAVVSHCVSTHMHIYLLTNTRLSRFACSSMYFRAMRSATPLSEKNPKRNKEETVPLDTRRSFSSYLLFVLFDEYSPLVTSTLP